MRGPLKRGDPKGRSVRTWRDHAPPMAGRLTSRARQKLGLAPCCKYADDTLRSDSTGNTSSTRIYRWPERSAGRTDCFPSRPSFLRVMKPILSKHVTSFSAMRMPRRRSCLRQGSKNFLATAPTTRTWCPHRVFSPRC